MPVFLVTPLANNFGPVGAAIRTHAAPADVYELQSNAGYFVKFAGTTIELSHLLGITKPDNTTPSLGSAMVIPVTSYYGRASTNMWEWLKARIESP